MSVYILSNANVTPSGTAPMAAITSAASTRCRIVGVSIFGRGTTSNASSFRVGRCTVLVGGSAATAGKVASQQRAAGFTAVVNATSATMNDANGDLKFTVNGNGGGLIWKAKADFSDAIEFSNGEIVALAPSTAGTAPYDFTLHIEEL